MKKRTVILLVVGVLLILLNILLFFVLEPFITSITAKVPTTGSITFTILEMLKINITSPENKTYDLNFSQRTNLDSLRPPYFFEMQVNATSNREIGEWGYFVTDGVEVYDEFSVTYSPATTSLNETNEFKNGVNELYVFGRSLEGSYTENNVSFFINVTDVAPIIILEGGQFFVCEDKSLNIPLEILDVEGDLRVLSAYPHYENLFWGRFENTQEFGIYKGNILSGDLNKTHLLGEKGSKIYPINITAVDSKGRSAIKPINATLLEINKIPEITNPPSIPPDGVNPYPVYIKLYLKGEHKTYNESWTISDKEDGLLSDGNLKLNLTYANGSNFNLFSINNLTGEMFYEATEESPLNSPMLLNLSVTDNPLVNPHENLSEVCGVDGSSNTIIRQIYFLVTEDNRPPEITSYFPLNETLEVNGEEELYFNISFWDDDHDTLSTEWFVGDKLINGSGNLSHNSSDEFKYTFGCGIEGSYNITVLLKDADNLEGVNNTWQVYVNEVSCPERPPSGGGGGASNICYEDWVCEDWSTCQSLKGSYQHQLIDSGDYQRYIEQCKQLGYDQEHWGFQMRNCYDINNCNNFQYRYPMPLASQVCFYTEHPSCSDGIKNCHSGSCELAVDCGGPCPPCPTCNDGIRNQGEEGIDCGGPCPYPCEKSVTDVRPNILLILIIFLVLILLFVLYRVIVILRKRREKKDSLRQQRIHQLFHQD